MNRTQVKTPAPPKDFETFWHLRCASARMYEVETLIQVPTASPSASYQELVVANKADKTSRKLYGRYVHPTTNKPCGLVLCFPDFNQGVRGWHHVTRYVALGYAAAMFDTRLLGWGSTDIAKGIEAAPQELSFASVYTDALRFCAATLSLPNIDRRRFRVWGEGLGGACALCVAALLGDASWRCAVSNPMPVSIDINRDSSIATGPLSGLSRYFRERDPSRVHQDEVAQALSYIDASNFAYLMQGELLVGTGLLDEMSRAEAQDTLVEVVRAGSCAQVRHVRYPRHGHERINEFENELVGFLV